MEAALRLCSPHHLPQLHAVAIQSYREHYMYLWSTPEWAQWYMNRSFSLQSLKKQMRDPGSEFYFVPFQGTDCGFIKINWNHHLHPGTDSMELERIYLLSAFASRGIGAAVMQHIVQMAKEKGRSMIWLKSMDSSPALRFYQKCGFHKTATERLNFEGLRDEFRNMWIMERDIGSISVSASARSPGSV